MKCAAETITVVRGVISGENTPPSRSTSARTSRLENNVSVPVVAHWSPANGCRPPLTPLKECPSSRAKSR